MEDGRLPTTEEQQDTLRLPLVFTGIVLAPWMLGALLFGVAGVPTTGFGALKDAAAIALGGVTSALLAFLLLERSFRPLYAVVFAARAPSSPRLLGITPRILLAWALGSGVPILVLLSAALGESVSRSDLQVLIWYFGGVGLTVGALLVAVSARSVAVPVEALRRGVTRVDQGYLDTSVSVDNAGEIGLLQANFNQMINGLRERQRLQDLFGRHVGEDVAVAALERGVELGGELMEVSVLFVDLVGSTTLARQRTPHEVVEVLNDFFAAIIDVCHAEAGWVNKFEGDAALCVFGAPNPLPDHRARALRCARAMRAALERLSRSHSGLDAGIGVSSGTVVAGHVGAPHRYEYTVIGDPVNEAARLTDLAKQLDERVAASDSTVDEADADRSGWRCNSTVTLRGRDVPHVRLRTHTSSHRRMK